ncbi:MAG: hypothetical protein IH991_24825 [Planctomycetes bacterium]|nr:hypothetical protein [Planctomycetota bacterium]
MMQTVLFEHDRSWLGQLPGFTDWGVGCGQLWEQLQELLDRYFSQVTGRRPDFDEPTTIAFACRLWVCLSYHWCQHRSISREAILEMLQQGEIMDGHKRVNLHGNVLYDVVLAEAILQREEQATAMFEREYRDDIDRLAKASQRDHRDARGSDLVWSEVSNYVAGYLPSESRSENEHGGDAKRDPLAGVQGVKYWLFRIAQRVLRLPASQQDDFMLAAFKAITSLALAQMGDNVEAFDDWWDPYVDRLTGYVTPQGQLVSFRGQKALRNWLRRVAKTRIYRLGRRPETPLDPETLERLEEDGRRQALDEIMAQGCRDKLGLIIQGSFLMLLATGRDRGSDEAGFRRLVDEVVDGIARNDPALLEWLKAELPKNIDLNEVPPPLPSVTKEEQKLRRDASRIAGMLFLSYEEKLSNKEIAGIYQVDPGNISRPINRGTKLLKEIGMSLRAKSDRKTRECLEAVNDQDLWDVLIGALRQVENLEQSP